MKSIRLLLSALVAGVILLNSGWAQLKLLNVSYDPTREFYADYNKAFAKYYKEKTGKEVVIEQSHGGSGKQARAVLDGLQADVVTLGLSYDIDILADKGLLDLHWQQQFPSESSPYKSTIVLLVRKGNPKGIKDWDDLVKPGISVITPNPKTSGGARWNYLAAWGYALDKNNNDETKAQAFVKALYKNVPVLDSGARGSTTTFASREVGDVLITWENEAYSTQKEFPGLFEIIYPSISILAEPPVAVVEANTNKHGTTELAKEYLNYLYSPIGQDLAGKYFFRPSSPEVAQKYASQFPQIKLFTLNEKFGLWRKAQRIHFNDGGLFDKIYKP